MVGLKLRRMFMSNFTIIKHYGTISTTLSENGYKKEVNFGIWYNHRPKIDIRNFKDNYGNDEIIEGYGITFSKEETIEVVNYLTKLINFLEKNKKNISEMHNGINFGEDIIYGSYCRFEFRSLGTNEGETIGIKRLNKENGFIKLMGIILFEEENTEIKSCKVCIQYFSISKDKKILPDSRGITLDTNYEIKKTIEYLNTYLNDK
jgi:hypothetical protein